MSQTLVPGEEVIWTGRPDWRSWAGLTILGWVLAPVVIGVVILLVLAVRKRSVAWKVTNRRIETENGWLSRKLDTLELWKVETIASSRRVSILVERPTFLSRSRGVQPRRPTI